MQTLVQAMVTADGWMCDRCNDIAEGQGLTHGGRPRELFEQGSSYVSFLPLVPEGSIPRGFRYP